MLIPVKKCKWPWGWGCSSSGGEGGAGDDVPSKFFPTKCSAVVFVSYMALFINQGILITATKNSNNTYSYNPTTVILITELLKLLVATGIYVYQHNFKDLIAETSKNRKVLLLYFVPALLYCLYNNLSFINLVAFDPTTYFLLLQLRVVVTGIVFQILFKKSLSCKQWLSLLLLTVGCIIKQIPATHLGGIVLPHFSINLPLIFVQIFCSCFAGVYNEFLLKNAGSGVPVMLQNVFMYADSIVCNAVLLTVSGQAGSLFAWSAMRHVFNWKVLAIIVNNAAVGLVTSLFLHSLNSILKTFASALELMFTAVLCWLIFGIPVDVNTVVAILVVSFATVIYAQNPVVNKPNEKVLVNGVNGREVRPLLDGHAEAQSV